MRTLAAYPAAEIAPRRMMMLWRDRIPAGTLSVIAGAPGLGKSTLGNTICAELSRDGISSVLSNMEDDPATVTRPRLDVAAADLSRVYIVPPDVAPAFPRDLELLENLIRYTNAGLVLLDPFRAHFHPENQIHHGPVLREVVAVARRTRCAIVGIHHTVKSGDGTAIGLVGGAYGGLAGTARALYVYGYDPKDEDRRALACVKIAGVDTPPALVFAHETVEYEIGGDYFDAGLILVVGEGELDARELKRRGRKLKDRDEACSKWLSLFLAAGEDCSRRANEVRVEGAQAGHGWQTLVRAAARLAVEKQKRGSGRYGDQWWTWRLPDTHPLRNPEPEPEAEASAA